MSALLDVDLFVMDRNPDGLGLALGALESYAPRIQKLKAVFGFILSSATPLLCSGIEFPAMTSLHLEGPGFTASPPIFVRRGIELKLFAPNLRALVLCHVILRGSIFDLLVQSLRCLRLTRCTGPDCTWTTFAHTLGRCDDIEVLSLDQYHTWGSVRGESFGMTDPHDRLAPPLPSLGSLALTLVPNQSTSLVLEYLLRNQVIHDIRCFVDDSPGLDAVIASSLRGLEPLCAVEFSHNASITVYDVSGRIRSFQPWDCGRISVSAVWGQLAQIYDLTSSVQQIQIVQPYWNKFVRALATAPLPRTLRGTLSLHVLITTDDATKFAHGRLGHMSEMCLPGLRRVVFSGGEGVALTADMMVHFLELITWNDGICLDVSIAGSTSAYDPVPLATELEEILAVMGGGQWRFQRGGNDSSRPGESFPRRQDRTGAQGS
ncbi:hypothetical protein AURDEDRAFT_165441 [Auricularia subglabra TFB-10046 SS5]|nr:hypothetical protein AURDEDRAFT_165441 [Auricularia subglabra TFB-10046 SS5]